MNAITDGLCYDYEIRFESNSNKKNKFVVLTHVEIESKQSNSLHIVSLAY